MIALRASIALLSLAAGLLPAADFSTYRGFQFGSSVATAGKTTGITQTDARLLHRRPARIEELEWRPDVPYQLNSKRTDPVREGLLRFYNGQLFQIISIYDSQNIEGLTLEDMVEAISKSYGTASKPNAEIPFHSNYSETAPVLARWETAEYSCDLVRTGDKSSYALVLSQKKLNSLAQAALIESARLDIVEAPQRAMDLEKKIEADGKTQLNKARTANKPNFKP